MLLIPADPDDGKNVIVEIRGAEGGEEANLFARDLFQMYQAYAARMGWSVEVLSTDLSDLGGLNQVTFLVKGDSAWSHLKFEGGPHRVQRVPVTESSGRIHTSSATVLVLPEAEEVEVEIDPNDLQIDVYRVVRTRAARASTPRTPPCASPTGPRGSTVAMQDERSQLQNRARAMTVLRARLLQAKQDEQAAAQSAERRSQVGGGGRSEKIRTYNFKENRVSDHRIGLTLYKLQQVLAGDLDEVVEALMADERARQLAAAGLSREPSTVERELAVAQLLVETSGGSATVPRPAGCARRPAGWRAPSGRSGWSTRRRSGPSPALDAMVARRLAGEPLQYVLGHWAFRDAGPARRPPGPDPAPGDRAAGGGGPGRVAGRARPPGPRWSSPTWVPAPEPSALAGGRARRGPGGVGLRCLGRGAARGERQPGRDRPGRGQRPPGRRLVVRGAAGRSWPAASTWW